MPKFISSLRENNKKLLTPDINSVMDKLFLFGSTGLNYQKQYSIANLNPKLLALTKKKEPAKII